MNSNEQGSEKDGKFSPKGFNDQTWWEFRQPPAEIRAATAAKHPSCIAGDMASCDQEDTFHRQGDNDDDVTEGDDETRTEEAWKQSRITVSGFGSAGASRPRGLTWQRVGRHRLDGLLYGMVDSTGRFSGDNITFVYPDLRTGLHGTFRDGELVAATEVRIVAARCRGGMKELLLADSRPAGGPSPARLWRREDTNATFLGSWPLVMDPHERRAVYAAPSRIAGAGEGLFARRSFLPGNLVSYYR